MLLGHIELHTELRWGCPPYRIVFGKACHLPGNKGNSSCKSWTNSPWRPMRTLGSISPEKRPPSRSESKLRSRWDGPFVITNYFPYGAVELKDEHTNNTFQVNGHRIKLFHEGPTPTADDTL
ncbi:hypothetical protein CR513_28590, partial [Mucuna pruriens]